MEKLELLAHVLNDGNPALFLGAGFSREVKNKETKFLPMSNELACELYDLILDKHLTQNERNKIFKDEKKRFDLKYVCDLIDIKKLNQDRDKYLTKRFLGCNCDKNDYHELIREYSWRTIFSLNIDDLVENIYEQEVSVQLLGGEEIKNTAYPILIKLHGSVLRPELGYIFNTKEYDRYLSQNSWSINAFGTEYYRNDMIFLGTEFQEEDLGALLNRLSDTGSVTKAHNYFFISPKIENEFLEMEIEQNSNFHHIEMTTEQFFNFVVENAVTKKSNRKLLKSQGAIFIDEEKRHYRESYLNAGRLYQGDIPQFDDFFGDWDIRYPDIDMWLKDIFTTKKHCIVSLYGEPYVGKTCIAMRMLLEMYNQGYYSFSFSVRSGLDAVQYSRLVLEYLQSLPQGTRCVILAENMAYYYSNLKYIIDHCPSKISQLIYLVTADASEHLTKKYIFDQFNGFKQYHIDYKINNSYALNIYEKLNEKSHLNNLLKFADNPKGFIKVIQNIDDIIDVLYVSQEGRKFSDHFAMWIQQKNNDFVKTKSFAVLCFLGSLGITEIPIQLFLRVIANMGLKVKFDSFYAQYKDYLIVIHDVIKIRCLRILKGQALINITEQDKFQVIYFAASYYSPYLRENETTPYCRIFQTLIKVKKLSHERILNDKLILELITKLENSAKHLSYYWIQLGIANRNLERFEEANNAFLKAVEVRGNKSYNIEHAQAKNYMAWGLWMLQKHKDDAHDFFTRGKESLQYLIVNSPRRYFAYSIHSYTDMMIKYFDTTMLKPDIDEITFIIDNLNEIPKENDKYSSQIIADFKAFCMRNGISCNGLIVGRENSINNIDIDDLND